MIAAVCAGIAGVFGVISLANDFLPAHRGYVNQATKLVSDRFDTTMSKLDLSLKTLQAQQNDVARETLRKEQFELGIKFREEQNPTYKALMRQRMDQIEDALAKIK